MPTIRLLLVDLFARAATRPPGYVEDVCKRGTIEGEAVILTVEAVKELREKYGGDDPTRPVVKGGCCG